MNLTLSLRRETCDPMRCVALTSIGKPDGISALRSPGLRIRIYTHTEYSFFLHAIHKINLILDAFNANIQKVFLINAFYGQFTIQVVNEPELLN